MWQLPPDQLELIDRPLIAPINETEIAFLSFGNNGGVAIYNVESRTVQSVVNIPGSKFKCYSENCRTIRKGQVGAVVTKNFHVKKSRLKEIWPRLGADQPKTKSGKYKIQ